jgi:hypothetical protein
MNSKMHFPFIVVFMLLFSFGFGQIQFEKAYRASAEYPILNETVYMVSRRYVETKRHIDFVAYMIQALKTKLELDIDYILVNDSLSITYKSEKFLIQDIFSDELTRLCNFLEPDVEQIIKKYHLPTSYEPYLCDLMLSETNGAFYDSTSVNKIYNSSYTNHLRYVFNNVYEIVTTHTVYDINQKPVPAGTAIKEINHIPTRILTTPIIDKILYKYRFSEIPLTTMIKKDTSVIMYCNNKNQSIKEDNIILKIYNDSILYMKFKNFKDGATNTIKNFLNKDTLNIKHVLIDIRECPGGVLSEIINTIELFVKKGQLIYELSQRSKNTKYFSKMSPLLFNQSITILTDSFTSSGSEILLFALKEFRDAKIIGQKTMGFGNIHQSFSIYNVMYSVDFTTGRLKVTDNFILGQTSISPDIYINGNISTNKLLFFAGPK